MIRIIGGIFQGHSLYTPKSLKTRPTQSFLREALFNICQGMLHDTVFLDIFAGSGAMGFEALSRGAKKAIFIDSDKTACLTIHKNAEALEVKEQCKIIQKNALRALQDLLEPADIIYIDPPYDHKEPFKVPRQILMKIAEKNLLQGSLFLELPFLRELENFSIPNLLFYKARKYGNTSLLEFRNIQ